MYKTPIKSYTDSNGIKSYFFTTRIGKKIITRRGFFSKREAEATYFNLRQDYLEGRIQNNYLENITYSQLYQEWLKNYEQTVRKTTLDKTKEIFDLHIIPFFGEINIKKISIRDCQNALNSWITNLTKYRTVYNYSNKIFKEAIKLGYINKNPMERIDIPKNTKHKEENNRKKNNKNFYSKEELKKFLHTAYAYDYKKYVFFRLLAYTGMRRGECLALEWNDVDFKNNYLTISKSLHFEKGIGKRIGLTKNGKTRKIILDGKTVEILKDFKTKSNPNIDIIFPNQNGEYTTLSKPRKWQEVINKAIGLNHTVTIHGFRHTQAVLLYDMNPDVTPKDVQFRLGHSNVDMTMNVYEHVTENSDDKILKALKKF